MQHHVEICRNYARLPNGQRPLLLEAMQQIRTDLHEAPDTVPMQVVESYTALFNGLSALFARAE